MNEILTSFLDGIKERLSGAFFGPFIFSWMVINYEIVFIVLFEEGARSRILMANSRIYDGNGVDWWAMLIYPLVAASSYVSVVPAISVLFGMFRDFWTNMGTRASVWMMQKRVVPMDELHELYDKFQERIDVVTEAHQRAQDQIINYRRRYSEGQKLISEFASSVAKRNIRHILDSVVQAGDVCFSFPSSDLVDWAPGDDTGRDFQIPRRWADFCAYMSPGKIFQVNEISTAFCIDRHRVEYDLMVMVSLGIIGVELTDEGVVFSFIERERSVKLLEAAKKQLSGVGAPVPIVV